MREHGKQGVGEWGEIKQVSHPGVTHRGWLWSTEGGLACKCHPRDIPNEGKRLTATKFQTSTLMSHSHSEELVPLPCILLHHLPRLKDLTTRKEELACLLCFGVGEAAPRFQR